MEAIGFIDLNLTNAILLILIGFVGGVVSGFIGSGGAFVLTPAMMTLGAPGIVAVASNICHKFPKALVGAIKRNKYGPGGRQARAGTGAVCRGWDAVRQAHHD